MENHVMLHQLIGLTNPDSKDFSKVTGYITVSINVQGPGDEATQLEMGTDKQVAEKAPLMPSSVKKKYKQIYIRIFRGENLPIMDKAMLYGEGSIDAYLVVKYGQGKLKTKVVTMKNKTVDWMEEDGVLDVLERSFVQQLLLSLQQSVLLTEWKGISSSSAV